MYTKAEFGESLLEAVKRDYDEVELARWAYELYLDHANHLEPGLYEEMMKIVSLEGGDEFLLSESQIRKIGEELTRK